MHDILLIALGACVGGGAASLFAAPRLRRARQAAASRDAEIARLKRERRELETAVETERARAATPNPRDAAELAELRRRMDELADAILEAKPGPDHPAA